MHLWRHPAQVEQKYSALIFLIHKYSNAVLTRPHLLTNFLLYIKMKILVWFFCFVVFQAQRISRRCRPWPCQLSWKTKAKGNRPGLYLSSWWTLWRFKGLHKILQVICFFAIPPGSRKILQVICFFTIPPGSRDWFHKSWPYSARRILGCKSWAQAFGIIGYNYFYENFKWILKINPVWVSFSLFINLLHFYWIW